MEPEEGTTLVASDYYDSPYFNEFTVQALMARIYLYMQDWDNAIKYSSKLIDSDLYLLSSATTVYTNDMSYYDICGNMMLPLRLSGKSVSFLHLMEENWDRCS